MRAVKLRVAEVSGFPWPPFSRAIAHTRPQVAIPRGALAPALTWTLASDDEILESFASEDHPTLAFPFRRAGTGGEPEPPEPRRRISAKAAFYALLGVLFIESLYIASHFAGEKARRDEPKPALAARTIGALMTTGLPASANGAAERDPAPIAAVETRSAVAGSPRREPAAAVAQDAPSEPPPIDPPGWVSIDLPIQVQIFERGRFIGTNDAGRVAIASGLHELELVNESLQLRVKQTIYIRPDQTTPLPVELPSGTLNVNALPWSDVVVDGKPLGATPIGHVRLPIGVHQVLFRHPQLGEQVRTAVVRAGAETRITVDFRK